MDLAHNNGVTVSIGLVNFFVLSLMQWKAKQEQSKEWEREEEIDAMFTVSQVHFAFRPRVARQRYILLPRQSIIAPVSLTVYLFTQPGASRLLFRDRVALSRETLDGTDRLLCFSFPIWRDCETGRLGDWETRRLRERQQKTTSEDLMISRIKSIDGLMPSKKLINSKGARRTLQLGKEPPNFSWICINGTNLTI